MNIKAKRNIFKAARMTSLYILVVGVAFIILLPIYFLFTMSFMSDFEVYNQWPVPLYPYLKLKFKLEKIDTGYRLSVFKPVEKEYLTIAETDDLNYIVSFVIPY